MGLDFQEVEFAMIGAGGLSTDVTLEDQINSEMARMVELLEDETRGDKATLTIKVDLKKETGGAVTVAGSLKSVDPVRNTKAISAFISNGMLFTAEHRQQPLPNTEPTPIRAAKKRGETNGNG